MSIVSPKYDLNPNRLCPFLRHFHSSMLSLFTFQRRMAGQEEDRRYTVIANISVRSPPQAVNCENLES